MQGVDFGVTSILGVVSLMGIIVRNGIIMIDYAEELRKNGKVECTRCHLSFGPSSYASHLPYFGSCIHGCHPDDTGRQRTVDANGNRYLLRHTHHNGIFAYSASGLLLVHVQWLYT